MTKLEIIHPDNDDMDISEGNFLLYELLIDFNFFFLQTIFLGLTMRILILKQMINNNKNIILMKKKSKLLMKMNIPKKRVIYETINFQKKKN